MSDHDHSSLTEANSEHMETSEHAEHSDHAEHSEHSEHSGHSGHGDHAAQFRRLFWINLILAVPTVFFSQMVSDWFGYSLPDFPGAVAVAPVLGTIIFFYGGWPFLTGGWSELKSRQPGMMLLITLAITVAFLASLATTFSIGGFDLDFWWELAFLIVVMLLGHWLEMSALGSASGALDAIAELIPDEAERVDGDDVVTVSAAELKADDVVLVRPGGRVPADGTIVDGQAEFDESMVTGESKSVARSSGENVVAGTIATDSSVHIKVTAVGDDTTLAGIQRLVSEAQSSSSRAQALADRAAAFLFYLALAAGILTFVIWALAGSMDDAVSRTVTVLVIACPHALGLAMPLVIAISTERAAKSGVLIKNRIALEKMRQVDVVLFDKTGTLTRGEHAVTDTATISGVSESELLRVAAAVEAESEHPVGRAIVQAAQGLSSESGDSGEPADNSKLPEASDFEAMSGRGVRARVDGADVSVGGPALLRDAELDTPDELNEAVDSWQSRGASVLHIVRDGAVIGAVALEDQVRDESHQAIRALHDRGVKVAMITGDAQQVADAVAEELGIDEVFAEVLPKDKDAKVTELQERGNRVAMVGDGVNDAPALARAEVGIAIGAGTDVAIESAGVVLASSDPRAVLSVIELSRASYRKMWQNLVWAAGYNVVAIPLAAGALAFAGISISPAVGAVLMSLSTIVVALNAQLLRRVELDPASF